MNRKQFEIWEARERAESGGRERTMQEAARVGSGSLQAQINLERERLEHNVAIEKASVEEYEAEQAAVKRERKTIIITNWILAIAASASCIFTVTTSYMTIQAARDANQINAQLLNLNYLINQPILQSSYNAASSTIMLTNSGNLPILIGGTRILRADQHASEFKINECSFAAEQQTIAPKSSASFDLYPVALSIPKLLNKDEFFIPFAYQFFFQVTGDTKVYAGETILFIDESKGSFRINRYIPEVRIAVTKYTDFRGVAQSTCP